MGLWKVRSEVANFLTDGNDGFECVVDLLRQIYQ